MTRTDGMIWCDQCGVEIMWPPVIEGNFHYCCQECKEGFPCSCYATLEMDEDGRLYDPRPLGVEP